MVYVYILYSNGRGRIYKGFTRNLKRRLKEHNCGQVKSTKSGIPWILVYFEGFANESDARAEEKFLKTGKGKERVKYLLSHTLKKIINGEVAEPAPPWRGEVESAHALLRIHHI